MDFCSMLFLVCFFPLFLLMYYLVPVKCRSAVVFLGSLVAYGIQCPDWLPALIALVMINYGLYRLQLAVGQKKTGQRIAIGGVLVVNLAALILSKLAEEGMPGISFVVFCALAYQIDIFREQKKKRQVSGLIDFGAYLTFFPKLLSGPITRFERFRKAKPLGKESKQQLWKRLENGLIYFIIGLGYKVILADALAALWNEIAVVGFESISTPLAWIGMFAYSMEIYFDFHGYSMMAVGAAQMLGVELPRNFLTPYGALSVSEFYRRWHITLGQWFRDYVYIPLGGNRKGRLCTVCNLTVVWLLTGLWHGFHLNFLLWAGFLLVCVLLEKAGLRKFLNRYSILGHLYIWLVIPLSWIPFAIPDISGIGSYFAILFGKMGVAVRLDDVWVIGYKYLPFLLAAIVLSLPARRPKANVVTQMDYVPWVEKLFLYRLGPILRAVILALVFWWSVYELAVGSINPFMYFAF